MRKFRQIFAIAALAVLLVLLAAGLPVVWVWRKLIVDPFKCWQLRRMLNAAHQRTA